MKPIKLTARLNAVKPTGANNALLDFVIDSVETEISNVDVVRMLGKKYQFVQVTDDKAPITRPPVFESLTPPPEKPKREQTVVHGGSINNYDGASYERMVLYVCVAVVLVAIAFNS